MAETKYPECEKLAKVRDKSQVVGTFLEWLRDIKGFELAKYQEIHPEDRLVPIHYSIESLLAEHFEIDMEKVEQERQQILEDIRNPKPEA